MTISRGRRGFDTFKSDKHELQENVVRTGERALAIELVEHGVQNSTMRSSKQASFHD
jgi:hypothetical protein